MKGAKFLYFVVVLLSVFSFQGKDRAAPFIPTALYSKGFSDIIPGERVNPIHRTRKEWK